MRNNRVKKLGLGLLVIVVILATVGGYLLLSGGTAGNSRENGEIITSIDFRLQGFEAGNLGGDIRYRGKGINTDSPKLRIDTIGAEDVLIFNYDENIEYTYTGSSWIKFLSLKLAHTRDLGNGSQKYLKKGRNLRRNLQRMDRKSYDKRSESQFAR